MRNRTRVLLVGFTFLASLFAFAGLAGAQSDGSSTYVGSNTGPNNANLAVSGATLTQENGAVLSSTATAPATEPLAFTGSDAFPLVIAGGTVLLIGAGLLVARRRMAQA